jgi:hypothetical protein
MPEESASLMEAWEVKQDSLRDWRISGGSASRQVQWVLAKHKKDEEKAMKLETHLRSHQSGISKFGIFLRALDLCEFDK